MSFGPTNHKKVARIMKAMGLKGFTKRPRYVTTERTPGRRAMPGLVGREFTADRPNRVYVGDITNLPCNGGKNIHLTTAFDSYSRKLAVHALADHMRVSLIGDVLARTHGVRGSLDVFTFWGQASATEKIEIKLNILTVLVDVSSDCIGAVHVLIGN